MIGMNWMNRGAELVAQERVDRRPWSPLAAWIVVSTFQSTPCRFSTSRPRMTRSKVGLPPLSTR